MRQAVISALMALCLGDQALAGAWPRSQGQGFASVSTRLAWPQDISDWTSLAPTEDYYTIYSEYGLTDRLTIGFDIGRSVSGAGKTIVFGQIPIRQKDKGPVMSAQLGFGQINGTWVVRPGVMMGWGRDNGWIGLDSVAEIALDTGKTDFKLDATWGRNLGKDRIFMVQLQTGVTANDPPFARLAPSVVTPLGKRFKVETGVTYGLTGDGSMGLKLGLWTDF